VILEQEGQVLAEVDAPGTLHLEHLLLHLRAPLAVGLIVEELASLYFAHERTSLEMALFRRSIPAL
jgi:hypothetical protein